MTLGMSACDKVQDNATRAVIDAKSTEKLSRAILPDTNSVNFYAGRAAMKYASGERKGAIEDFTKAIELDKESATAWSGRATAKYADGDFYGALTDAVTAARLLAFGKSGSGKN